jgi:hypothetical protein
MDYKTQEVVGMEIVLLSSAVDSTILSRGWKVIVYHNPMSFDTLELNQYSIITIQHFFRAFMNHFDCISIRILHIMSILDWQKVTTSFNF